MGMGGQAVETDNRRRFAAFISYAHADAAVAAKLQFRLERYRLPKHLAGSFAGGQTALGQIFRDREDLAAAPSLSDAIHAAIAQAEALIVICSPDAAASRWVGEEIALFRRLHPGKPILAAVVRGEPDEAFPAALTAGGNEPLAADLRKGADGAALGFLKIVAGIAGVPLDALVQRDAQRRIRRVMWITGGAFAAMLVMGVMTTLALSARNEAARQRAEAEGLVEYMLTDLREKLKGVGRLDVMEGVNDRAIIFYKRQGNLTHLPPRSLTQRARILHAMGEDDEKRGNLKLALAKFREAHRATFEVLKQNANDPMATIAHAKSEYWVGYTQQKLADPRGAIKAYREYLKLSRIAVTQGLAADVGKRDEGWAHNALGVVYYEQLDNNKQAALHFDQYRLIFEKLWQKLPRDLEVLYSLADSHAWLAQVAGDAGNLALAVSERKRQIELLGKLFAIDSKNDQPLWSKIGAERELFRLCFRQDDRVCAKAAIRRATTLLHSQDFDQTNRDWLWQSAYVALDSGFLAEKGNEKAEALAALEKGRTLARRYKAASEGDSDRVAEMNTAIETLAQRLN